MGGICSLKVRAEGFTFMSAGQTEWTKTRKLLSVYGPLPVYVIPENHLRRVAYMIVMSRWFDPFITVCIVINGVLMVRFLVGSNSWLQTCHPRRPHSTTDNQTRGLEHFTYST